MGRVSVRGAGGPRRDESPESLVDQYHMLREGAGAYLTNRDVVTVKGADAESYLQGQCSQDVAALAVGGQTDTLLCSPEGKVVVLSRVVRIDDAVFDLDVAHGFGDIALERLNRFKLRSKVDITLAPRPEVRIRGAGVDLVLRRGLGIDVEDLVRQGRIGQLRGCRLMPVRWNGTGGVDIIGPEPGSLVPDGCEWCDVEAWEALRVEAGIPEMGSELDGRTIAAEAGLVERTVSFTKGCYTGQELVARLEARGNRVARRLRGVVLDAAATTAPLSVEDLRESTLYAVDSEKRVGECTSSAWCPGLGGPAALAYVHRSVGPTTVVTLRREGQTSGRWRGQVRALPMS